VKKLTQEELDKMVLDELVGKPGTTAQGGALQRLLARARGGTPPPGSEVVAESEAETAT